MPVVAVVVFFAVAGWLWQQPWGFALVFLFCLFCGWLEDRLPGAKRG